MLYVGHRVDAAMASISQVGKLRLGSINDSARVA